MKITIAGIPGLDPDYVREYNFAEGDITAAQISESVDRVEIMVTAEPRGIK